MTRPLRAIDLLGGAGGWACAARGLGINIVLSVDLWDVACRTYALNHPHIPVICGDVRDAAVVRDLVAGCDGLPVDLLLGAIPCEWLTTRRIPSNNPVSETERAAERATLDAVLQLVDAFAPTFWCLEDVRGLAKELPPEVPWLELDSARFSAQRRKRLYVGRFPAPILCGNSQRLRDKLRLGPYRIGRRAADRAIVRSRQFNAGATLGAYPDRKSPTVCTWSSRRDAELVVVDLSIAGERRQIEWQEAATLQGFPVDYVFYGSPTDVWKMIGQAIQIDTGRAILEAIVRDWRARDPQAAKQAEAEASA